MDPRHRTGRKGWLPGGKARAALGAAIALTIAWYAWRPRYYRWLFRRAEPLTVMVQCDTTVFRQRPPQAVLLYDRLALSPVSVALGLFQNRPPERVLTFEAMARPVSEVATDAMWIENVPKGPLTRILFRAGPTNFYVDVLSHQPAAGQLVVRAGGTGGLSRLPILPAGPGGR